MQDYDPIDLGLFNPVLSAAAMRDADAYAIESVGLPGFTLMESAGRAAVDSLVRRWSPIRGGRIVILCGRGNNGGDGLVMARNLVARGARVTVVTLAKAAEMSPDAAHNMRILERLHAEDASLELAMMRYDDREVLGSIPPADLYVDALVGTGMQHALAGPVRELVEWLNAQREPVVAVDIPTGLHADQGRALGTAVSARLTVTMGALKTGLLVNAGPKLAGEIEVAEIGIPRHALERCVNQPSCALQTTDAAVRSLLPRRSETAHKYSVGMTVAIAGSPGLTGAPVLASTAAARVGAGAVVCASHEAVQPVLASKLTEVMTLSLPGSAEDLDADAAFHALQGRLSQAASLLVGCGLGRGAGTAALVRRLVSDTDLPLVLDADGLNAFVDHTALFTQRTGSRLVLTPHEGEFRRLAGDIDLSDRVEASRKWSAAWSAVLVLKGMPSLVATPAGRVYICGTGGPALATAGTGDVLAGMIAGLLAQGLSPEAAALCGVHIGGACGDAYSGRYAPRSMQASDLLLQLPGVLKERFEA